MKTMEEIFNEKIAFLTSKDSTLLGVEENVESLQAAEQFRKAMQLFAASLSDEQALEIATIYPKYEVGVSYTKGDYFTYGKTSVGDPQLYKVLQDHVSQVDWVPTENHALYESIGLNESGYPVWSKPSGVHDAYSIGDIVDYNGTLYKSLINGNVYSPEEYAAGWEVVE